MVKFSIFQIRDIAVTKYAFRDWFLAVKDFDFHDYKKVYDGEVSLDGYNSPRIACEDLFCKFNRTDFNKVPDDFHGRSMSVSDIVVFYGKESKSVWYCDGFGFLELDEEVLGGYMPTAD